MKARQLPSWRLRRGFWHWHRCTRTKQTSNVAMMVGYKSTRALAWRDKEATATTSSLPPPAESLTDKFRNFATSIPFALVLLVPKLLRLRHNGRYWMAFRILLAVTGALLVIQPLRLVNPWLPRIIVMFLIAILLPAATSLTRVDDKVRELGALVVVNGGDFQPPRAVRAIPLVEVLSLAATQSDDGWVLSINGSHQSVEFSYRGVFGEHLAGVAESTIRSVLAVSSRSFRSGGLRGFN